MRRRFILFFTEIRLLIKDDFFFFSLKIRLYKRMKRGREHIECLHLADRIKYFSKIKNRYDYNPRLLRLL